MTQHPVIVFAVVEGSESDSSEIFSAVDLLAMQSRQETGCVRYELYRAQKAPVLMIIHETWVNEEARQAHKKSLHVERFKAVIGNTTARVWVSQCEPANERQT
jgi:quinol monooxygenase YgiN